MDSLRDLQRRQNEHLMSVLNETLAVEKKRRCRINKLKPGCVERKRLEAQYVGERRRDKERISRLRAEHQAIYDNKKIRGSCKTSTSTITSTRDGTTAFGSGTKRGCGGSAVVVSRLAADTVQKTEFYRTMYAKSEYNGSNSNSSRPSHFTASNVSKFDASTDLYAERNRLMSRLQNVNQALAMDYDDTASTVRSEASSFGSVRSFESAKTYRYIPFKN